MGSIRAAHNDQTCPQSSQLSMGLADPCSKLWLNGSHGRTWSGGGPWKQRLHRRRATTRAHHSQPPRDGWKAVHSQHASHGCNDRRLLAQGHSRQAVLEAYPYLDPEDLSEALAYAAWRAMEVDVEIGVP